MSAIVYLNGRYQPETEACVPVLDRGFIFGDGVYEVIPVYHGRLFRLEEHLRRLDDSLRAVRITNPHSHDDWRVLLEKLVQENGSGDLSVYLQVTRGVAKRDHAFPKGVAPTVFAMANPLITPDAASKMAGIGAVTLPDIRWQYCHIKAITLLPNILLRQQALDQGATEAILIRDGYATEGAASNLFMVKDGVIVTPPKSALLLPGITRDLIVELAGHHDHPCQERAIGEQELFEADEIWLTSSTKEIMAVITLNNQSVGNGKVGPVWRQADQWLQDFKHSLRK